MTALRRLHLVQLVTLVQIFLMHVLVVHVVVAAIHSIIALDRRVELLLMCLSLISSNSLTSGQRLCNGNWVSRCQGMKRDVSPKLPKKMIKILL